MYALVVEVWLKSRQPPFCRVPRLLHSFLLLATLWLPDGHKPLISCNSGTGVAFARSACDAPFGRPFGCIALDFAVFFPTPLLSFTRRKVKPIGFSAPKVVRALARPRRVIPRSSEPCAGESSLWIVRVLHPGSSISRTREIDRTVRSQTDARVVCKFTD